MKLLPVVIVAAAALAVSGADASAKKGHRVLLYQGFENEEEFSKLSPNGYAYPKDPKSGIWGILGREAVTITKQEAAVGERSVKVIRMEKAQLPLAGSAKQPIDKPFEAEVWFMREPKAAFTIQVCGTQGAKTQLAAIACDPKGEIKVWDKELKRYMPSGVITPAEEWTQLKFRFTDGKAEIVAGIDGEDKKVGEAAIPALSEMPGKSISCVASPSPIGAGTYFDEFSFTLLDKAGKGEK